MNTLRTILATVLLAGALVAGAAGTANAGDGDGWETIHNTVENRSSCSRLHEQRVREDIIDSETSEVVETRYTAWQTVGPLTAAQHDAMLCDDWDALVDENASLRDRLDRAYDRIERLLDRIERLFGRIDRLRDRLDRLH
jgi:hypothetical protein